MTPYIIYDEILNLFKIRNNEFKKHPITRISWFGAHAFGEFYNLKLPTDNQWTKSARYITENKNLEMDLILKKSNIKTDVIKSVDDFDFYGNVSEWTKSLWETPKSSFRAIKGGSCFDYNDKYFNLNYKKSNFATQILKDVGFRLVKN